MAQKTENS